MPLFSIIIPTYNHAHLIGKCLQSLIDQTYQNWEAIIVNNYSDDNTVDVVESFSDSRLKLISFHNKGVIAAARNEGIRKTRGDWIAFLDSDDWWYPTKLSQVLPWLKENDVIYHNLDVHTPRGKGWRTIKGRNFLSPVFEDLLTKGNQMPNSSVVVRKSLVEEVGGLSEDPNLFAIEDYDLWLRVSKISEKFHYLNQSLGAYWVGGSNYSKANRKSIERIKCLYSLHMPDLPEKLYDSANALLNYIVTRERMICGDKFLLFDFLRTIRSLKRGRFIFNSLVFGILSIFK